MEVLASCLTLHPSDMARSRHFYEQVLGLRIFVRWTCRLYIVISRRQSSAPSAFST